MQRQGIHRVCLVLALIALAPGEQARAQEQAQEQAQVQVQEPPKPAVDTSGRLFVNRCTGCHTIGRGTLTGPDLTKAITWREADLEIAIVRMQEKAGPLAKDEIAGLIAFLKDPAVNDRIAAEDARIAQLFAAQLEPPNAAAGERLFRGEDVLANGGMACLACHRIGDVGGGTLGLDLTGVFGRMGRTGLLSALEKAPFKVMAPVYRDKPLTRQEILHIVRWIETMDARPVTPRSDRMLPAAASCAAIFLAALVVGTRSSKRTGVREALASRRRS